MQTIIFRFLLLQIYLKIHILIIVAFFAHRKRTDHKRTWMQNILNFLNCRSKINADFNARRIVQTADLKFSRLLFFRILDSAFENRLEFQKLFSFVPRILVHILDSLIHIFEANVAKSQKIFCETSSEIRLIKIFISINLLIQPWTRNWWSSHFPADSFFSNKVFP